MWWAPAPKIYWGTSPHRGAPVGAVYVYVYMYIYVYVHVYDFVYMIMYMYVYDYVYVYMYMYVYVYVYAYVYDFVYVYLYLYVYVYVYAYVYVYVYAYDFVYVYLYLYVYVYVYVYAYAYVYVYIMYVYAHMVSHRYFSYDSHTIGNPSFRCVRSRAFSTFRWGQKNTWFPVAENPHEPTLKKHITPQMIARNMENRMVSVSWLCDAVRPSTCQLHCPY